MKTLVLLICVPFFALSQITFENTFVGRGHSQGYAICETSDGNYLAVGYTRPVSTITDSSDIFAVKISNDGSLIRSNLYGGEKSDSPHAICATKDGGAVIAADTYSWGQNGDYYLIRVNANGDTVWTRRVGRQWYDRARGITSTRDNCFIIAGYTERGDNGNYDVYLVKIDTLGNIKWDKMLGEIDSELGYAIATTADSGFIIAGSQAYGSSTSPGDVMLMKTDSVGRKEWLKVYKGNKDDCAYSVKQTADGGYILAGHSQSYSINSNYNIYLIRTNENGDTTWTRSIGDIDRSDGYDIIELPGGDFVITGSWSGNVVLLKITADGDTVWTRQYGEDSNGSDAGYSLLHTSDGGFIVAGYYNEYPGYLFYILKTDSEGVVTDILYPQRQPVMGFELIQNYPNPFNPKTVISYQLPVTSHIDLSIYNIRGQKVATLVSKQQPAGRYSVQWDVSPASGGQGFASGVYLYRLSTDQGFMQTKKLVLLR